MKLLVWDISTLKYPASPQSLIAQAQGCPYSSSAVFVYTEQERYGAYLAHRVENQMLL